MFPALCFCALSKTVCDNQSTVGLKEERNVLDELLGIQEDDLENDLDIDLSGKSTIWNPKNFFVKLKRPMLKRLFVAPR